MSSYAWSPADLLQTSGSYWSACTLHAAVKLDLFTPLSMSPLVAGQLADRCQLDERGLTMLLDALTAMFLLNKEAGAYRATPFASQYLSRDSEDYLGHIIMHHHHLVDSWSRLDESVRSGRPSRKRVSHDAADEERESFLLGMYNLARMIAPQVAARVDLSGRRHLLDLGGGPGTYAIHFCRENPELQATVFDLPGTQPIAEQTIRQFGMQERIDFLPGDFQTDPVAGDYDVAWLSHVLHGEDPVGCATMVDKAVATLVPGGLLLVQEFILDDTRTRPLFPALFSLNMLLGTPSGQAYSAREIKQMLSAAGLGQVRRLPISLPNGAGVICGEKTL